MTTKILFLFFLSLTSYGAESISFNGAIELEGAYQKLENNHYTSTLSEPTIELATTLTADENWSAIIALLHEDGIDIEIDEAFITYQSKWLEFTAGKLILPFLNLESSFISDPLTLELIETHTQAITSQLRLGVLSLQLTAFKSDHSNNKLRSLLVGVSLNSENLQITSRFISDITNSDFLIAQNSTDHIPAFSFSFSATLDKTKFIFESVMAMKYLQAGLRPMAYQLELSYALDWITAILGLQGTNDSLEIAKTRLLTGVEIPINNKMSASLEYAWDKSLTNDKSEALTVQLAFNF